MYIGLTKSKLSDRLKSHKCAKGDTKREKWIKDANSRNGIGISLIESVENDTALNREIYWTNFYFEKYPIVNLRIGNGASVELGEIISKSQKGKIMPQETIDKIRAKLIGLKKSQSFCDNLSKIHKGKKKPISQVRAMSKTMRKDYGRKVCIDGVVYGSIIEAVEKTKYTLGVINSYVYNVIKKRVYDIDTI